MKTIAHFSVRLAGAHGPDLMLKLTNRRGPDRRSSRAGFGPRAGLCRPLPYRFCCTVLCHYVGSVCGRWSDTLVECGRRRCPVTLLSVARRTAQSKYGTLILASVYSRFTDTPQLCAACICTKQGILSKYSFIVSSSQSIPLDILILLLVMEFYYHRIFVLLLVDICNE